MKILSPVGNFESLKTAIFNGADEIYLGINDFNARNNIDGFSMSNLKEAVDLAHIFNVKVNLAINILFTDSEMQQALDIVIEAYNMGVDSFIIQDIGLIGLIYDHYPEIEIHASTQMGIHNLEGVKFLKKFGVKRVVLARETPLDEIKRIKENSDIEIEYFAHGALCVSFSGNCYLSSYLCDASGNRGKCKQLCRLPYSLVKGNKVYKSGYLLSAKDFNMINRLSDLQDVGVDVIKIEGRARRPYYVGEVTKQYYNALNKNSVNYENLKLAFNRNFTAGYFDGNSNIISDIQNHIGIFVGNVGKVIYGKKFNEVYIVSNRELNPKSSFKIFSNGVEKTTLSAYDLKELSKGKYLFTTTQKLSINDSVHLIVDEKLEKQLLSQTIKRDIEIKLYLEESKAIKASFYIRGEKIELLGEILEKANSQPISEEDLINNFSKSEIFNAKIRIEKLDNVFITKQKLNEFRRNVYNLIFEKITNKYYRNLNKIKIKNNYKIKKFKDFKIIEDVNEEYNTINMIYSPEIYSLENVEMFIKKCKEFGVNGYLDCPNFALKEDIDLLSKIIKETKIPIIANNYYALNFDTNIVIGAGLNVYNSYSAKLYDKPIITAESNISSKIEYPYMTLRHCPMKEHLKAKCDNCPYSKGFKYKMNNGKVLSLKRKKLSSCTFYLV